MLTTVYQSYIIDCLKEIPYIRKRHLAWLLKLKFGSSERQLERDLRQLTHMGRITQVVDDGGFASLPQQRRDYNAVAAVDVMAEVCGQSLPEFLRGEPPCTLTFYIKDERGYLDFKVVPVPLGEELHVLEALACRYAGFRCTYLFLPDSEEQLPKLHTQNPAYFVFHNEAGGYDFLKKT